MFNRVFKSVAFFGLRKSRMHVHTRVAQVN